MLENVPDQGSELNQASTAQMLNRLSQGSEAIQPPLDDNGYVSSLTLEEVGQEAEDAIFGCYF